MHVERSPRLSALFELSARLPQRSVFNRLLLQSRNVDKLEIADVVEPQATLLAHNLFQQTAVSRKPGSGGKLVLRLRKAREEPRGAEGRVVVAGQPRALLLRRVPIVQQGTEVARLNREQRALRQQGSQLGLCLDRIFQRADGEDRAAAQQYTNRNPDASFHSSSSSPFAAFRGVNGSPGNNRRCTTLS